jgi:hypothetical protein
VLLLLLLEIELLVEVGVLRDATLQQGLVRQGLHALGVGELMLLVVELTVCVCELLLGDVLLERTLLLLG